MNITTIENLTLDNWLIINPPKFHVMYTLLHFTHNAYTLHGSLLSNVSSKCDLRLVTSESLDSSSKYMKDATKINATLFFMRR